MNYSTCLFLARKFLGPTARVWRRNGQIEVGTERVGTRTIIGEGTDYFTAFKDCFAEGAFAPPPIENQGSKFDSKIVLDNSSDPNSK